MTQDEQHLDLLAIFHYVVGGLMALVPCFGFIHVGMGIAMLCGAFDGGKEAPPPLFGWFLILLPGLFMTAAWTLAGLIIAAGRKLNKRRAYTFCLVMGAIECLLMPLGTVLGVFTIIVLTRESVKDLFAAKAREEGW
jgi:hypothetical protein